MAKKAPASPPYTPTIALVMAHHSDFDGAYFSIQHAKLMGGFDQYVLVDNSARDNPKVAAALNSLMHNTPNGLYVPAPDASGTSASRNLAIRSARADIVVCIDCHVLLAQTVPGLLRDYFANPSRRKDIVSGPLLYDNLVLDAASTHFNVQWRDGMWGTWGTLWRSPRGTVFSAKDVNGKAEFVLMEGSLAQRPVPGDEGLPSVGWAGHEAQLVAAGCEPWVRNALIGNSVEIPGQGLGMFATWRENWIGFHEAATGFGGEELNVHEAARRAGGNAVCIRGCEWNHRFFRADGIPYRAATWQKVRNYVLWAARLGLPPDDIRQHFLVDTHAITEQVWHGIMADPIAYDGTHASAKPTRNYNPSLPVPPQSLTLPEFQAWFTSNGRRDFEMHIPAVSTLAEQCNVVAEFSSRRETTIGLMSCRGAGKRILSYNDESGTDAVYDRLADFVANAGFPNEPWLFVTDPVGTARSLSQRLPTVDLLLLDTVHSGARITAELDLHAASVTKYIVIHDTTLFAESGEDGGLGMAPAIEFWVESHPEWYVLSHTDRQYGLTVLSRIPELRPADPLTVGGSGGPGTELHRMLNKMGIMTKPTCGCRARMKTMDEWGSAGCRANLPTIVQWIQEAKAQWGIDPERKYGEILETLTRGLTTWEGWNIGVASLLSLTDPIETMIKIAISRAERKKK